MKRVLNQRPVTFFAFFFIVGIAIAYYADIPEIILLPALLLSAGIFLLFFFRQGRRMFWALYLIAFFLGAFLFQVQFYTDFTGIESNREYTVQAFVSDRAKMSAETHTYTLTDVSVGEKHFGKKVLLYSGQELDYGDTISFTCKIEQPSAPRNPGTFDEQMYLAGKGAGFSVFQNDAEVMGNSIAWYQYPLLLREKLAENMDMIFSEQSAPVVKAMFLGVKDELPQELRDSFSRTGIAHILAISGLHIAVISYAINFLLKKLRAERRLRFSILICLLLFYATITGFAPSILRAVLMTIFVVIGRWKLKDRDTLTFLSAALVMTLLFNTAQLFGAGLTMSYGVVFGILCLNPPFLRLLRKIRFDRVRLDSPVSTSLSATAAVFPMTAYYFNNIALAAPVANLFAIPLAGMIVVFAGIGTLASLLWLPAGYVLAFPAELAVRALTWINGLISQSAFGYIEVNGFPVWMCFVVMAVIFLCSDYVLVKRKTKAVIAALVAGAVLLTGAAFAANAPELCVTVLDVATGDAIHIAADGNDYLIDNGGNLQYSKIDEYAQENNLFFDAVIVTNTKTKNLKQLAKEKRIGTLFVPQGYEPKEYDADYPVKEYKLCDRIELSKTTGLRVTGEDGKHTSLTLSRKGEDIFLFAQNAAQDLAQQTGQVKLFKPAGGAAENSVTKELLERLKPECAVVSVKGDNSKGLPDELAMDLLEQCNVDVKTTAQSGAVIISFDDRNRPDIKTMK